MTTDEKYTALHYAVKEGRMKTVEYLCQKGVDVDIPTALTLDTPLHMACKCALKKVMSILLKYGANPNLLNSAGQSSLFILTNVVDSKELVQCFLNNVQIDIDQNILDENLKVGANSYFS